MVELPLQTPAIKATPGYLDKQNNLKYQGFFSFGHLNDSTNNFASRTTVINKARNFSRNAINACLYAEVNCLAQSSAGQAAYKAHEKLIYHKVHASHNGNYRICVHQNHCLPTGMIFKLFALPPDSWDPNYPLHLA